jgi:tetratricopeptide (TPR) repeat protein
MSVSSFIKSAISAGLYFSMIVVAVDAQVESAVTADEMITALQGSKLGLATANRIVKKSVEDRGVGFEIDDATEARLRSAGANDDLIKSVRLRLCATFTERAKKCKEGDKACLLENYNKALKFHPNDVVVLNDRGNLHFEAGNIEAAIRDYTASITQAPNDSIGFLNRGNAYFKKNEFAQSVKDYSRAIELNSKDSDSVFNRAKSYAKLNQPNLAIKDLSR